MNPSAPLALVLILAACTPQQQAAVDKVVVKGQLFCAKATAAGPLVVALADAYGAPVIVTNQAAGSVQAACAAIGAIPVSPPPNPAAAPTVAANVSVSAVAPPK